MNDAQNEVTRSRANRAVTNLDSKVIERIDDLAEETGRSRADIIRSFFMLGWTTSRGCLPTHESLPAGQNTRDDG